MMVSVMIVIRFLLKNEGGFFEMNSGVKPGGYHLDPPRGGHHQDPPQGGHHVDPGGGRY